MAKYFSNLLVIVRYRTTPIHLEDTTYSLSRSLIADESGYDAGGSSGPCHGH